MPPDVYSRQFGAKEEADLARFAEVLTGGPVEDYAQAGALLQRAEVLITSWGSPRISAETLDAAPALRAVIHAAGSVKRLVSEDVYERGVQVVSAAEVNAIPVAEFALAATIFAGKRAWPLAQKFQNNSNPPAEISTDLSLTNFETTIGVIGFSNIGRRYIELLRVLETKRVLVFDPFARADHVAAVGAQLCELPELLSASDTVSIHAPLLPETRGMIGARELAMLSDGATLINTARGGLIDHEALYAECRSGRIQAILDVTEPEPLPEGHPLRTLPNVTVTPHLAGSLGTETRRLTRFAVGAVQALATGADLPGTVTREKGKVSA